MRPLLGATLLEFATVVALVTILTVWSYPQITSLLAAPRLTLEARYVSEDLKLITLEALKRESTITFVATKTGYLAHEESSPQRNLLLHTFKKPVRLELIGHAQKVINFYPSGAVTPSSLKLTDGERSCLIKISLRGRVKKSC